MSTTLSSVVKKLEDSVSLIGQNNEILGDLNRHLLPIQTKTEEKLNNNEPEPTIDNDGLLIYIEFLIDRINVLSGETTNRIMRTRDIMVPRENVVS